MTERAVGGHDPTCTEAGRLAALHAFDILDTEPEVAFDDLARVAAQVCHAPIALVSLVADRRQWFKAEIGLGVRETALDVSICARAMQHSGLFVVPDATKDPTFAGFANVMGEPHLRFYAGAPLVTRDGCPLGTLCILDRSPRPEGLTQEQANTLLALARAVMSQLELRRTDKALVESAAENRRQRFLFDTAIENIKHGLCFFDGDQRLIVCNDRYAAIYGLSAEQTRPGTTLRQIVEHRYKAGTCPEMSEADYLVWRGEIAVSPVATDTLVKLRDGRTLAIHHEPMPDGGWVATHDDITSLVDAQNRLSASEGRYRALVEASTSVVWHADAAGRSFESERWGEVSGQRDGGNGDRWLEVIHPDDRERVARAWRESIATGRIHSSEHRFWTKASGYRWVIARGVPLKNHDGSVREWVGTLIDNHERKQAEAALGASEERLRLALESAGLGIWDLDLRTGARQWSPEMPDIMGLPADTPADAREFLARVHPDDRARIEKELGRLTSRRSAGAYTTCFRILRGDNGDQRWVEIKGRLFLGDTGEVVRRVGTIQDITQRKLAEEALRASEERLRLALRAGRMVAWEKDLATGFITRSKNSADVLGIGSGPVSELLAGVCPEDRATFDEFVAEAGSERSRTIEFCYKKPSGETIWLGVRAEQSGPNRLSGVTFDITERKAAENEVWRMANKDPLTGLLNRALFQRRLEEALEDAEENGTTVSLLLIDLDGFKDVNDTLGHDAGDALLVETANRLSALRRDCDTVARLGGDEFAVIIVEPLRLDHARQLGEFIIESLREPILHAGRSLTSNASVGVAAFPDHHREPHELMKDADIALYRAKAQGRNRVVVYSPEMRDRTEQRVLIARGVREALKADQIVPFYQPKVCFATGEIVGFEALARWQHPTRGVLTPGYFGSAFEDPALATAIGESLVRRVATDVREWLDRGLDCGRVAVNLSAAEFSQPSLADWVLEVLAGAGVPTANFEVEVTETVFLGRGSDHASAILKRFHESGVLVALDDFGTGFASLTHLKQFPVDHIKIDQSFVRDLEQDTDDAAIVAAVIGLGKSLDMQVTAEGVETAGQARRLREMGCDHAQGYHYAKPMIASRVPWAMSRWSQGREVCSRRLRAPG